MASPLVKQWRIRGSKPLDLWTISLFEDEHLECDCPSYSFKNRSFCKHTQTKRLETDEIYGNMHNYLLALREYEK